MKPIPKEGDLKHVLNFFYDLCANEGVIDILTTYLQMMAEDSIKNNTSLFYKFEQGCGENVDTKEEYEGYVITPTIEQKIMKNMIAFLVVVNDRIIKLLLVDLPKITIH